MHPEQLMRRTVIDFDQTAEFLLGQYHDAVNLADIQKTALEKNTHGGGDRSIKAILRDFPSQQG
jgi:hypothetical protein